MQRRMSGDMGRWVRVWLVVASLLQAICHAYEYDFYNNDEDLRYTRLDIGTPRLGAPTNLTFEFTLNIGLSGGDAIEISMPGFTRSGAAAGTWLERDDEGLAGDIITPLDEVHEAGSQFFDEWWAKHFDLEFGAMARHHTMASVFSIQWREGNNGPAVIYPKNWMNGTLTLLVKPYRYLPPDDLFRFTIRESAGFSTICGVPKLNGFPEIEQGHWYGHMRNEEDIGIRGVTWKTNSSSSRGSSTTLMYSTQVGDMCQNQGYCNNNGYCDFCRSRCECEKTHGGDNATELGQMNALRHSTGAAGYDCSTQTCPIGKSFRSMPSSGSTAHSVGLQVLYGFTERAQRTLLPSPPMLSLRLCVCSSDCRMLR